MIQIGTIGFEISTAIASIIASEEKVVIQPTLQPTPEPMIIRNYNKQMFAPNIENKKRYCPQPWRNKKNKYHDY